MNTITFIEYETDLNSSLKNEIDKYIKGFSHVAFCGDNGYVSIVKGGYVVFQYTISDMKEKILQMAHDSEAIKLLAREVVTAYKEEIFSRYFKIVVE